MFLVVSVILINVFPIPTALTFPSAETVATDLSNDSYFNFPGSISFIYTLNESSICAFICFSSFIFIVNIISSGFKAISPI